VQPTTAVHMTRLVALLWMGKRGFSCLNAPCICSVACGLIVLFLAMCYRASAPLAGTDLSATLCIYLDVRLLDMRRLAFAVQPTAAVHMTRLIALLWMGEEGFSCLNVPCISSVACGLIVLFLAMCYRRLRHWLSRA